MILWVETKTHSATSLMLRRLRSTLASVILFSPLITDIFARFLVQREVNCHLPGFFVRSLRSMYDSLKY
jgi:hypothetical protein